MLQQHELCFIRRRDGPGHGNACCIRTDRFQSKRHVSLLLASFHALRLSLRRLGIPRDTRRDGRQNCCATSNGSTTRKTVSKVKGSVPNAEDGIVGIGNDELISNQAYVVNK